MQSAVPASPCSMKRLLPLLALGLFACAETFDTPDDGLGTVQGTVFDDFGSASGTVVIGLAELTDTTPFIVHSVEVLAEELPYEYSFDGVDPDAHYHLIAFVDAGEASELEAMSDDDRLEISDDEVRALRNGVALVTGVNLAL